MPVTYSEAAANANRSDNFGIALKTPQYGGPAFKNYTSTGQAGAEYIAEHPRYPDYQYPIDKERDTYYQAKSAMARALPTGVVSANDKDIQYMIDKKNAAELALFKQFVEDSIPRGTPWAKEFFERIMPGWYQSKIDIIQEKLSIVNRLIEITIRGPQNIDDMFLLYQCYAGKIIIPQNWAELIRPTAAGVAPANFASGLINPKRWITTEFWISHRNQKYLANFGIPGIDFKGAVTREVRMPNNLLNVDDYRDAEAEGGVSALYDVRGRYGAASTAVAAPDGDISSHPGPGGVPGYLTEQLPF